MLFLSFAALLATVGVSSAASVKRTAGTATTLFAYGGYSGTAPVFYADGFAYFGLTPLSNGTVQTNITLDTTGTVWPITANGSSVTFNSTLDMYINTIDDSWSQVGFSTNASLPSGAVNNGFQWFGTEAAYVSFDGTYQMQFWGVNTSTPHVYALYWNAGSTAPDGTLPIVLKST